MIQEHRNLYSESISIVVPVYNSEESLPTLVTRLISVLRKLTPQFEIILVNDGSQDQSWNTIYNLCKNHSFIQGINLGKNYGQHNALLAGIRAAQNEIILTIDDDLQSPPEEIPKLIHKLNKDIDVVYGTPLKEQHGLMRDLASRMIKLGLTHFLGAKMASKSSSFRAFRSRLKDDFKDYQCDFISIDILLSWTTDRFSSVKVAHQNRKQGQSNYNLIKLYRHSLNMLTGYSTFPLQLASAIGLFFTGIGVAIFCFVLFNYFIRGNQIPGFAFLASTICIFSGATLFSIGILGEYLARMYSRSLQRPAYTIRETSFLDKEPFLQTSWSEEKNQHLS